MKRFLKMTLALSMALLAVSACSDNSGSGSSDTAATTAANAGGDTQETTAAAPAANWDSSKDITIVSRENGSGTRSGFIELFGIQVKDADGKNVDRTSDEAEIADATDVMLTKVKENPYAVGYVSLGSLNDSVKAVKIDGVEPTLDNIKTNAYTIHRPFNIVYKGELSGLAKDFVDYIMSAEGQAVVLDRKYIKVDENAPAFAGTKPAGELKISGSSSVTPLMEKLAEAYQAINTGAKIIITQSDSGTGIKDATNGTSDIGMASRELKDEEKEALNVLTIATDGIVVIVNKDNPTASLTKEQVASIYMGDITKWNSLG